MVTTAARPGGGSGGGGSGENADDWPGGGRYDRDDPGGRGGAPSSTAEAQANAEAKVDALAVGGAGADGGAGETASSPTRPRLTEEDKRALHYYSTTEGADKLNRFLRGVDRYDEAGARSVQAKADTVSVALSHLPKHPGETYRGADFSKLPHVLDQYQPGKVVTEAAFTSTSTDPKIADSFQYDGDTLFIITGENGSDISKYSDYPESEVLYDKGTDFLVEDRYTDPKTGQTVITMTEVS
ncbi:ADP-ribosyltransferase [Glycomyces terrestris]|nr:ADP-ribosyltransferase [Glycomyces terrestris]